MTTLADRIGLVAAEEFERSTDTAKPRLLAWIERLPALDDAAFLDEAMSAIHGSAIMNNYRGNANDVHCQASACHHESQRRHRAAGHAEDCRGSTLYERAFRQVWLSQGHDRNAYPVQDCTCGAEGIPTTEGD